MNLRFYVRRTVAGELRRGVVFVREMVPRWAVAKVAQVCFGERYMALPMRHKVVEPTSEGGRVQVEYGWRQGQKWSAVRAEASGRPALPPVESREAFFAEHYWGYAAGGKGGTLEYRVEHDRWRIWPAATATFEGDAADSRPEPGGMSESRAGLRVGGGRLRGDGALWPEGLTHPPPSDAKGNGDEWAPEPRCKRSCPVIPSDSDENVSKARARRMNRNARIFCFLVLTLAALGGCSSQPPAKESKKAATAPDRIQGKAQVLAESSGATDAALNAGGPSVYLWEGAASLPPVPEDGR